MMIDIMRDHDGMLLYRGIWIYLQVDHRGRTCTIDVFPSARVQAFGISADNKGGGSALRRAFRRLDEWIDKEIPWADPAIQVPEHKTNTIDDRLRRCPMPKRPIRVSDKHAYLKARGIIEVSICICVDGRARNIYGGQVRGTDQECWARARKMSIDLCRAINDEIRRQHQSTGRCHRSDDRSYPEAQNLA